MSDTSQRLLGPSAALPSRPLSHPVVFGLMMFSADVVAILGASFIAGMTYHALAYGDAGPLALYFRTGLIAALFFTLPYLFREQYRLNRFVTGDERLSHIFFIWNYAFLGMIAVSFLAHSAQFLSRGAMVAFWFTGFGLLVLLRSWLTRFVQYACRSGRITARQLMLVGTRERIAEFRRRYEPWNHGLGIAHTVLIDPRFEFSEREGDEQARADDEGRLDALLGEAVAALRRQRVDDVILLLPWSRRALINRCAERFTTSSVSVHLGPQPIFDRFIDARLTSLGSINTLTIVRPPLSGVEVAVKRGVDIVGAGAGLLLLSPLLIVCVLLIRLDSPGPALFRQRRYGFNFEPFEIIKFRTMTVMEDGDSVRQAVPGDARITRVGAFLRRWNIDELPQLVNVLKGDMSLVGPRPHALAHDHEFLDKIALYARRMNVRPGITGLAQVNGWRGPTDTDEKIRKRVEYDLHYIDNWSVWLDLRIMFLTVFSRRAYDNAV